jgi:hypothetical protein
MLNKEQIQAAEDRKPETHSVPEWGGEVCLRCMSGPARESFEEAVSGKSSGDRNFRAHLLVRSLCDEKGQRIFTDQDVDLLGDKSAAVLIRLAEAAMRLSGIGASEKKESATDSPLGDDSSSA